MPPREAAAKEKSRKACRDEEHIILSSKHSLFKNQFPKQLLPQDSFGTMEFQNPERQQALKLHSQYHFLKA